jgi:hypothetical protein
MFSDSIIIGILARANPFYESEQFRCGMFGVPAALFARSHKFLLAMVPDPWQNALWRYPATDVGYLKRTDAR